MKRIPILALALTLALAGCGTASPQYDKVAAYRACGLVYVPNALGTQAQADCVLDQFNKQEAQQAQLKFQQQARDNQEAAALGGMTTFLNGFQPRYQQPRMTTCQPIGHGPMLSCY